MPRRSDFFNPAYLQAGHTLTEKDLTLMREAFTEQSELLRECQEINRKLADALDPKDALAGFTDDKYLAGLLYCANEGRKAFARWVDLKIWLKTRIEERGAYVGEDLIVQRWMADREAKDDPK